MTAKPERAVLIVDDDPAVRDSLGVLLEASGYPVITFASGRELLSGFSGTMAGCLVVDVRMPDMTGIEILETLAAGGSTVPVIIITGHADVPMAVRAMKVGAFDFLEKPVAAERLLTSVEAALARRAEALAQAGSIEDQRARFASLTPRERDVLDQLIIGRPNKVIAAELGISPRTVEIHRARVMEKLDAHSLSHLVRMAIAAGIDPERPLSR